jgi:hypothetical protein
MRSILLRPRAANTVSITIQLDLPDAMAKEARANGLLESAPIRELLAGELRRRKAALELNDVLAGIQAQPGEPASMEEIVTQVKAARKKSPMREAGH